MGSSRGDEHSGKEVPTFLTNPLGGNRGNTLTVNVTKEVVSAPSWGKLLPGDRFGRKKTWSFVLVFCPPRGGVQSAVEFLIPSGLSG